MRSILKIDKIQILNIKFKKFKKFKKHHRLNKLRLSNFFMSSYCEQFLLCERIMILEAIVGDHFKITKFKFYNNNKKHFKLGVLIFLKVNVYKKKIFACLSYFFIYQFFLYYEFFLKVKVFNSTEFVNYFRYKPFLLKNVMSTNFYFFMCWADFADIFVYPTFKQYNEIFNNDERESLIYVQHTEINFIIFYKFNDFFLKVLKVLKKNMLKMLIFFYKKFFLINLLRSFKIKKEKIKKEKVKKLKLLLAEKYLKFKKKC